MGDAGEPVACERADRARVRGAGGVQPADIGVVGVAVATRATPLDEGVEAGLMS